MIMDWRYAQGPRWFTTLRGLVIMGLLTAGSVSNAPAGPVPFTVAVLVVVVLGWLAWLVRPDSERWLFAGLAAVGLGGVVLSVTPNGVAFSFVVVAAIRSARRLRPEYSLMVTVGLGVLFAVACLLTGRESILLTGGLGILAICELAGLARRQSDQLREQSQLARAEQARAEALAQRAQLAREVHDVLAHSLGALSVQLESADALLEHGRAEQAREAVGKAGRLARDGLAETRRAIGVLRGDTVPLSQLVRDLAAAHEAPVTVCVDGDEVPLVPQVSLALYRTVQESLTNTRKYAPGATVTVQLTYSAQQVEVTVTDTGAGRPTGQLATTGGGYGLTGLRERAELLGGVCTAGPRDGGWAVDVRIPL
ncbi:histidine kinase [Hamadaea sp. NPDC051192]|uniref:sensor histidine kinase n=1 Tax=Hamadaea sp. NPDC051192 TaxID=3154940 RepID=UPI00342C768C